mmetsp:Transcript_37883/g.95814  ORF Transcript_37883/g.95814 Transcript_37883/m.95814 type:complete len:217 (-) Transcript_37883:839-1489(-)
MSACAPTHPWGWTTRARCCMPWSARWRPQRVSQAGRRRRSWVTRPRATSTLPRTWQAWARCRRCGAPRWRCCGCAPRPGPPPPPSTCCPSRGWTRSTQGCRCRCCCCSRTISCCTPPPAAQQQWWLSVCTGSPAHSWLLRGAPCSGWRRCRPGASRPGSRARRQQAVERLGQLSTVHRWRCCWLVRLTWQGRPASTPPRDPPWTMTPGWTWPRASG